MWDGSLVVAANNHGTCYVWRLLRGNQVAPWWMQPSDTTLLLNLTALSFDAECIFLQTMTNFEPLHKLQAHNKYILKCLLSPEFCDPHRFIFPYLILPFFCFSLLYSLQFFSPTFFSHFSWWIFSLIVSNFMPARYLATASADHTVKIWNVDGFTLEKTLIGNSSDFPLMLIFIRFYTIKKGFNHVWDIPCYVSFDLQVTNAGCGTVFSL